MLYNFALVIEAKKIHRDIFFIDVGPNLVGMQRYQITFRYCPQELDGFIRVFLRQALEVGNKRLRTVAHQWIVLDVVVSDIPLNGLAGCSFISHFVKGDGVLFIRFQIHHAAFLSLFNNRLHPIYRYSGKNPDRITFALDI